MTVRNSTAQELSLQVKEKSLNEIFLDKVIAKNHSRHFNKDGSLRYDYSKIEYKNNHTNIAIICPKHGLFEQAPSNHLKGMDCRFCHSTSMLSNSDFIERASKVHNNYYDYSKTEYKGTRVKIIITCPKHGDFEQKPQTHTDGGGCRRCAGNMTLTTDEFIKKSVAAHGNKYNYHNSRYVSNTHKLTITCRSHGDFEQMPDTHMRGKGCPTCGGINQGWSKTDFKKACQKNPNGLATLYVIKCFNNTECFYKVGITSRPIKQRFSGQSALPYKYKVVHEIKGNPNSVWDVEVKILKDMHSRKHKPKIGFGGDTECVSSIKGIEEYLKMIA